MAKPPKKAKPRSRSVVSAVPAPAQPLPQPQAAPAAPQPLALPRLAGFWSLVGILASFLAPGIGLTLGLLYAPQEDRQARNFGRWCLVAAALGWLVSALTGAVRTAMGNGEWFVQPY